MRSNQNKCQEITWPKLDHALSTPERDGGRERERERATSNGISLPTDIHTNFPLREYFVSYSFSLDYEIVTYIHIYIYKYDIYENFPCTYAYILYACVSVIDVFHRAITKYIFLIYSIYDFDRAE